MRQADCSGRLVLAGWGGEQGAFGGHVGSTGGSERKQMGPLTGIGSTELAGGLLQSCPAVSVPRFHNYPPLPQG